MELQSESEIESAMGKSFTKEEVIAKLKYFAGENYKPEWEELIAPSLRIVATKKTLDEIPVGASRFGGPPDLPEGMAWPVVHGKSNIWERWVKKWPKEFEQALDLMAQINLAEVATVMPECALPEEGILYFFMEQDCSEASEFGLFRRQVLYSPRTSDLVRAQIPGNRAPRTANRTCSIQFIPEMTVQYGVGYEMLDAMPPEKEAEWEKYEEVLSESQVGTVPKHRLLGHADPMQCGVEEEVESEFSKRNDRDGNGKKSVDATEARKEWNLLLQLDEESDMRWQFGFGGMLYFLLRTRDLQVCNFDKTVVWFQGD